MGAWKRGGGRVWAHTPLGASGGRAGGSAGGQVEHGQGGRPWRQLSPPPALSGPLSTVPPTARPAPRTGTHTQTTFLGYGEWASFEDAMEHAERDYTRK